MASELARYAAGNARARTLLARLLGRSGLEALYTYPSLDALVDALKRTPYGDALLEADRPELQLAARLATVGKALLTWLPPTEGAFLREYLLRHELANLKILIRAVHGHVPWERSARFMVGLGDIGTIDMHELARADDLTALVGRLAGSRYAAAANSVLRRLPSTGPFALEVALELDYYDRLWGTAEALRPGDAHCARQILGVLYDILNLGWMAQYRDVWGLSREEILNYTLRQGRWVTLDVRRHLAEDRAGGWQSALAPTPYAELAAAIEARGFDAASAALWRLLAEQIQTGLSGYPFHIGVPLGLLLLQEIEIRDLQVLLAAKRLQVPVTEVLTQVASVRH
jgi:V/A-type H+/Na+-transporting ATPase subunit C